MALLKPASQRGRVAGGLGIARRIALALLAIAAVSPLVRADDPAGTPRVPEYVLKAGFLYNFAKYVTWPPEAFEGPQSPIVVGVVGPDPFGQDLERTLVSKTAQERPFLVKRYRGAEDVEPCHILFVAGSDKGRLAAVLARAAAWPALIVGEAQGFCESGGAVCILIQDSKPRLVVNPAAATQAKLTIDAKVLKLATLVKGEAAH